LVVLRDVAPMYVSDRCPPPMRRCRRWPCLAARELDRSGNRSGSEMTEEEAPPCLTLGVRHRRRNELASLRC
jgi:hypothetical protein